MQRHRSGRRAKTLSEDQLRSGLMMSNRPSLPMRNESTAPAKRADVAAKRRSNRGALPPNLPGIEILHDLDDKICRCCCGQLHQYSATITMSGSGQLG